MADLNGSNGAKTYNYLRIALDAVIILLIPVLIYFNSKTSNNSERLIIIETTMTRVMNESAEVRADIKETLRDHEIRLRTLERQNGQ
jgi:hypothetical protein